MNIKEIQMLALSACSGGGKGTAVNLLLTNHKSRFVFSVSWTTRDRDVNEVHGVHYHFTTTDDFLQKVKGGFFLEYEEVSGKYYGTPKHLYEEAVGSGKILLLDIDVKGARRLKKLFEDKILCVFIDSGDDISVYEKRIRSRERTSDDEASIQKRLKRIPEELPIGRDFEVVLQNRHTQEIFLRLVEDVLVDNILKLNAKCS